jgi:hypothetical protein
MRALFPPLVLCWILSGVPAEPVELAYRPEDGTTLRRTFEARAEYERTELEFTLDGEPFEPPEEPPDFSLSFLERIVVSDELVSVADGRPTELVRTFEELLQESTYTSGEEELETTAGSELEGRELRFTWDSEAEEYDIEAADGEELDEERTEWLIEDMDLRALLPGQEVEPGDEWELEPELYLAFMWPGGLLDFREEGQEESGDATSRQTIERLEGTGQARLLELREEDGLELAVIEVELEITTGSADSQEVEGGELELEVEIERTITGTILWDIEHGHAHSAELEAEASRLTTRLATGEDEQGNALEFEQAELLEGTISYRATIERQE